MGRLKKRKIALTDDRNCDFEIRNSIGKGKDAFKKLNIVWINRKDPLEPMKTMWNSCVISVQLYGNKHFIRDDVTWDVQDAFWREQLSGTSEWTNIPISRPSHKFFISEENVSQKKAPKRCSPGVPLCWLYMNLRM